ncbi:MAG: HlyC/CorC family transporter [Deltaproteobacteria bacterium]|nr:HlyC/CorC family transporter [Deltaproteobacteria bacterium]
MTVGTELAAIVALALANGLFAGAEIAMLSVRKGQLTERAEEGHRSARVALALREQPERFLATVQIGITVIGATAAAFGGASLARRLGGVLETAGLSARLAEDLGLAAVIAFVSYLSLVLGELVPKSLALRHAERYTLLAARPLALVSSLARPVVWLLTTSSNLVLRVFGDRTSFAESRLSPDELQQLLEEACTAGALDRRAGDIAVRALDTVGLRVDAVKVPRSDIVALRRSDLRTDLLDALRRSPHARYPVIDQSIDDTVGLVTVRDVAALLADPASDLSAALQAPWFVPETRAALDVLGDMQRSGTPLGLVVDEVGAVTGLVSIEDLLEELVGEIRDAHRRETPLLEHAPDGSLVVSGRMAVHDVNRLADLRLPEDPTFTTIGGLVLARAGRIPRAGAAVEVEGMRIEIVESTPRRIVKVRIHAGQDDHESRPADG